MSRAIRAAKRLLTEAGMNELPIPVEDLVKHLGASLTFEPFDGDLSGMLYREGTKAVIGINSRHAQTRQRFTIAHELGHLLLHGNRLVFVDKAIRVNFRNSSSSLGTDAEEIEANSFAAELLMPQALVQRELKDLIGKRTTISGDRLIRRLAKIFDVSPQSMEYRLANLGFYSPA